MVPGRLSPTGTSASSPGSGITQRRYGGDRNRAKVGEDERGAGPFLEVQRFYLASGDINLNRSRAAPLRTRNPGEASSPGPPLVADRLLALALTQLRLTVTLVPSRWASSSTPEEHLTQSWLYRAPDLSAIWSDSENIYSVRVLLPLTRFGHRAAFLRRVAVSSV
jgi:hypothetical protein